MNHLTFSLCIYPDDLLGPDGRIYESVYIQLSLGLLDPFQPRFCCRMLGQEYRAAVLVGLDGFVVGADFLGLVHYVYLVHGDERAHDGHGDAGVGDDQGLGGLAGYLPQVFAGHEHHAAVLLGHFLGDAHHEAAHEDGGLFFRAVLDDLFLDGEKVDYVYLHRAGVAGDYGGEFFDFLLGSGAGVWV